MRQLLTFAGSLSLLSLCLSPCLLLYYTFSVIRGNGRLFIPETAQDAVNVLAEGRATRGNAGGRAWKMEPEWSNDYSSDALSCAP
jgi:hypothetical protein